MSSLRLAASCIFVIVILTITTITEGQVTFSRDWNAGKRNVIDFSQNDCSSIWRSVTSLCNNIVKNLHNLSVCELKNVFHNIQSDDQGNPMFNSRL